MNTLLWAAQAILSAAFLYSGIFKTVYSEQQLIAKGQTGVAGLPAPFIHFIGISEILAAIGFILPCLLNVFPVLTPIAAICCGLIMVPAAVIHTRLHEPRNVATNVFLFVLCVLVVCGRL